MARTRTRWHLDPARIYRRCVSQKVSFRTRQDALDRAERQMEAGRHEGEHESIVSDRTAEFELSRETHVIG